MAAEVLQQSRAVRSKRNEEGIAGTGIERAEGAFQPVLNASVTDGKSVMANTPEEQAIRASQSIYRRTGTDYSASVSKLFATGAKVEAKATMSRFLTNIIQTLRPNEGDNYRTYYGLSVTQPLLRDAGPEATLAKLRTAEIDTEAAAAAARDAETTAVAEAAITYYDLALAQERVTVAEERLLVGQRLLAQANDLFRQGRLPEADVWEVEASLLKYRSFLSEAQQQHRERLNRLRTLLMAAAGPAPAELRAADPLPMQAAEPPSPSQGLAVALERREDFRMRRQLADREGVQLAYAKNQSLPRIDLVASYGLNGLALSAGDAYAYSLMRDFPTWSVGFQLSVPLGENRQAKADMVAARLRQEEALLQLQALEVAIANDIDTSVGMLASAAERWAQAREIAQREQQQLELERKRLVAGRSGMRDMLYREERALNARFSITEQQVGYAKAEIVLQAAQGTLLDQLR